MKELHHTIDFIRKEEYLNEDYPKVEQSYSYHEELPTPEKGEIVEFGYYEEGGEKRTTLGVTENLGNDEIEYTRSEEFRVVSVKNHYHYSERTKNTGEYQNRKNEVTTKVLIRPCRQNEEDER